ncbi:MAG: O-acetyl-ADP-ribose deacetylase [Sandaracinaceae bacterium]|nr:O-acetyl-ADP-ribose deacetylase [Sandaracinaceae bacterium]
MTRITIVRGDITKAEVDAIVNAANERMLGGGGVDGAIHRAAGPELLEACRAVPEVRPGVRCPTGEARVTPGFALPAKYVIHTVGPRYSMPSAPALLASAFRSSLTLASDHADVRTVALPAVSCGVYGYPIEEAAAIALRVAREREWALDEIRFVLFGESDRAAFERAR